MADTTPMQSHRSEEATIAVVLHRLKSVEALCAKSIDQGDDIKGTLASIDKTLALGNQRMNEIDAHLENTDKAVAILEADKRGVAGLWAGVAAGLAALGSYFK